MSKPVFVIGGSSFLNSDHFRAFETVTVENEYGPVRLSSNKSRSIYFCQVSAVYSISRSILLCMDTKRHHADPDREYSPPHLLNQKAILQAAKSLVCVCVCVCVVKTMRVLAILTLLMLAGRWRG